MRYIYLLLVIFFSFTASANGTGNSWSTHEDLDRVYLKFNDGNADTFIFSMSKTAIDSERYRVEISGSCKTGIDLEAVLLTFETVATKINAKCIKFGQKYKVLINDRNSVDYILTDLSISDSLSITFNGDVGKKTTVRINKSNFDQKIEEAFNLYDANALWLKCKVELNGRQASLTYGFNISDEKIIQSPENDGMWLFSKTNPKRIENWLLTKDKIGEYFRKITITPNDKLQYEYKQTVKYSTNPNENFQIIGICNRYW